MNGILIIFELQFSSLVKLVHMMHELGIAWNAANVDNVLVSGDNPRSLVLIGFKNASFV